MPFGSNASSSGFNANSKRDGDSGMKNRTHHDGSANRSYTIEQKQTVIRILKCSPTSFYDILDLESVRRTCSDSDIKKAYRRLSLLTHPDKNGHTGADEAFKLVSRAFQVLSDPTKRSKYDKFGGDPDSRFASSTPSASPFTRFSRTANSQPNASNIFEPEISPEDLFRQFFGGAGIFGGSMSGGRLFDGGPGFIFNFGNQNIRMQQFGWNNPRRRATRATDDANSNQSEQISLMAFLPLLIILLPFFLNILQDLFIPSSPTMIFSSPHPPYTLSRHTNQLHIQYWTNPSEVESYTQQQWDMLDRKAEVQFMKELNDQCQLERQKRDRLYHEAHGWLFTDQKKINAARKMKLKSCERLDSLHSRM